MDLGNLIGLLILVLVFFMFWQRRGISEAAAQTLKRYCEVNNLQLISIARHSIRYTFSGSRQGWLSEYHFELSSNRERIFSGTLTMLNDKALRVDVPPYPVD